MCSVAATHVASVPVVMLMLPQAAQDTWDSGCSIGGNITTNIQHRGLNTIIGNMNTIIGTNTFVPILHTKVLKSCTFQEEGRCGSWDLHHLCCSNLAVIYLCHNHLGGGRVVANHLVLVGLLGPIGTICMVEPLRFLCQPVFLLCQPLFLFATYLVKE